MFGKLVATFVRSGYRKQSESESEHTRNVFLTPDLPLTNILYKLW